MKINVFYLIFFMFSVCLFCQEDYQFSNLITYGESEKIDISFTNIEGSTQFIEKFNLSDKEINMIGYWTDNFYSELKQNGKNVRILGLDFFPNRIMEMTTECFVDGERVQKIYFFNWKIENEMVYLKLLAYLSEKKNQSVVLLNNLDYEALGEVKFYNKNFILRKPFDFSFMNSIIHEKKVEFGIDDFRYRILLGKAMPSIYDKIGTNYTLRHFLLNFDTTKESDFLKLEENYNRWD